MAILLNILLILIAIAGILMLYHLVMYYRTSSDQSVRGYDVERHYTMTTSRATILATLIAIYVITLAFTSN